jgi:hypothetical protein
MPVSGAWRSLLMGSWVCCRVCVTFGMARRRRPNAATYLTMYVTGETLPTCEMHARQAIAAAAVAVPLASLPGVLVADDLSSEQVRNLLQAASTARRSSPPVLARHSSSEITSGSVVITVTPEGVRLEVAEDGEPGRSVSSA